MHWRRQLRKRESRWKGPGRRCRRTAHHLRHVQGSGQRHDHSDVQLFEKTKSAVVTVHDRHSEKRGAHRDAAESMQIQVGIITILIAPVRVSMTTWAARP